MNSGGASSEQVEDGDEGMDISRIADVDAFNLQSLYTFFFWSIWLLRYRQFELLSQQSCRLS
jgi:hypothetical protein